MAKKNPNPSEKVFANRVTKQVKLASQETAQELGEEIQEAYEVSVEKFYDSYKPSIYERTYSLAKASSGYRGGTFGIGSLRKMYEEKGNIYEAGITINPAAPHYSNKITFYCLDPENDYTETLGVVNNVEVFNNAFIRGIHGFNQTYYDRFFSSNQVLVPNFGRIPEDSTPIKTMLDRRFSKISDHSHIDKVFSKKMIPRISNLL